MSENVNYGIIGCGMMGQEHIRNIALMDGAAVVATLEPDPAMAAATALLVPDATAHGSVASMLDDPRLDALVIASPNFLHVPQIMEIAERRALPLLVEKPLYTGTDQAAVLSTIRYPAPIWVAMEYRYMPPIASLIARARDVTGPPAMLTIREHRFPFLPKVNNWNRFNAFSGGTFVEKCCHFFDLMRLILDAEPVRVMASAGQVVNHLEERYGGRAPDILDSGYVMVEFDGGQRAMLELCMFAEGARYQEELSLVGPRGKIEARVPGPTRFWPDALGAPPVAELELSPRAPKAPQVLEIPVDPALLEAGDHNGATFYQHSRFREVVLGRAEVEVTLSDGMRAVEMGLAAQTSAATGLPVDLAR
ncbi:Gfo/Idh/MocA family protein [Palleronia rufa]|uniref:Gfo/Idh/MocA family protein n=1 Tax=Palleronia rufa TaxID=1530186 RepID=UPI00055FA925|nr:Gfo/Idh/MocA family oxidoreductase [Palleronia rufa]